MSNCGEPAAMNRSKGLIAEVRMLPDVADWAHSEQLCDCRQYGGALSHSDNRWGLALLSEAVYDSRSRFGCLLFSGSEKRRTKCR